MAGSCPAREGHGDNAMCNPLSAPRPVLSLKHMIFTLITQAKKHRACGCKTCSSSVSPRESTLCVLYKPCQSSHACPAYLTFPTNPLTHTHPESCPSITPWGAPWRCKYGERGGPVTRVMSGTYGLSRGHSDWVHAKGAAGVVGCGNAGVSVDILYFTCSSRCSLADVWLACLCQKGSKYVKVRARGRPAHRLLFSFPFSDGHFFFFCFFSSSYHKHPRPCVYLSPSSLLLSPSSSRTRNLHRPARLNLSFSSGARGSGREGEGGTYFFFSIYRNSPLPRTLPKRETTGGPCPL